MLVLLLLLQLPLSLTYSPDSMFGFVKWNQKSPKDFEIQISENGNIDDIDADTPATAKFRNAMNFTGWSMLEIKTNPGFSDKIQVA